jgi:xylulokinase
LLEAHAYAIAHHVEVMNEIGYKTDRFIVSGGGSTSEVWMQIVADVLERPVQRLAGHPCVGAARTAAIGLGLASDWSAISAFVRPADRIELRREAADVYRHAYRRYRDLYRRLAERSHSVAP